jgi:type IV pilus assembly protein PilW
MTSHSHYILPRSARPSQTGFTLVELMVGLAIGMLAALVVMQVFSVFEVQKRTTTGTADAQTDGNIALYTVTRELQKAGFGLIPIGIAGTADSAIECPVVNDYSNAVEASGVFAPVTIVDGGSGSDSISIRFATSSSGGVPTRIRTAVTGPKIDVIASVGCVADDVVLVMNGSNCALTRLTSAVVEARELTFYDSRAITAGAAVIEAKVACLGNWNTTIFSIDPANGNLLQNGVPVVAGIVNMQAQYGISATAASTQITSWVDATGAPWSAPGVSDRNRIKAVRIAIVARSATFSPDAVTTTCTSDKGTVNKGPCAWDDGDFDASPKIDLSLGGNTTWDHYRYKVFETIIPLRNMMWAKGTL